MTAWAASLRRRASLRATASSAAVAAAFAPASSARPASRRARRRCRTRCRPRPSSTTAFSRTPLEVPMTLFAIHDETGRINQANKVFVSSEELKKYEALLRDLGHDYAKVRHPG